MLDVNAAKAANDANILNTAVEGVEALLGEKISKTAPLHEQATLLIGEIMMLNDFYPDTSAVSTTSSCCNTAHQLHSPSTSLVFLVTTIFSFLSHFWCSAGTLQS
jgi:hypothetical protein